MKRSGEIGAARREGRLEAERLRLRLGLADEPWVDVFDVIESSYGLDLFFRPLKNLYGFYWSERQASGIVVNASHPSSLRRFTAAHELGHHILGHGKSVDEVANIHGAFGVSGARKYDQLISARSMSNVGDPIQEAAAQAFAGSFLMPLQQVNRYLRDHIGTIEGHELPATDIYKFAVEFGASFGAACTQLAVLEKISWRYRTMLLNETSARRVATEIGYGVAPQQSRGEVVFGTDVGRRYVMEHDAELLVELVETPSTGHVWTLQKIPEQLTVIDDQVVEHGHKGGRLGASQTRHFRFEAKKSGLGTVQLGLRPAWQDDGSPVETRVVEVHVMDPVFDAGVSVSRRTLQRRVSMAQAA